jgi:hypothetical protein
MVRFEVPLSWLAEGSSAAQLVVLEFTLAQTTLFSFGVDAVPLKSDDPPSGVPEAPRRLTTFELVANSRAATLKLKTDDRRGTTWKGDHTCVRSSCNASDGVMTAQCTAAECGEQLQAVFDSCCPTIKIPARADGSPWVTATTLWLRSNSNITFDKGVTVLAMRGQFKTKGAPLFLARNISNLTINGYGATWKMWKFDYDNPGLGYCHSEARPGLWMTLCTGCRIFGLTVTMTGGDGIEVVQSKDVHIKDVVLDNNYRQGMSVVGIENMLVENSIFSNTGQGAGTPPMCGVDIEPDPHELLAEPSVNLTFKNCRAINNKGGGYSIAVKYNDATTYTAPRRPMGVLFDHCSVEQAGGLVGSIGECDAGGGYVISGAKAGARGNITIRNAVIEHTATAGIHLINTAPAGSPRGAPSSWGNVTIAFENVQLRSVAASPMCTHMCREWFNRPKGSPICAGNVSTHPIMTTFVPAVGYACCAASFLNVSVTDTRDRPFMFIDVPGSCGPGWGNAYCMKHWRSGHNALSGDISVSSIANRHHTNVSCRVAGPNNTIVNPSSSLRVSCKTDDASVETDEDLHVCPRGGDDAGPGSAARPFASLYAAQLRARRVLSTGVTEVNVVLCLEVHLLNSTLQLRPEDSGTVWRSRNFTPHDAGPCTAAAASACGGAKQLSAGNCVCCRSAHQARLQAAGCADADLDAFCEGTAQPGTAQATISGGLRVEGWHQQPGKSGVWVAATPAGAKDLRHLWGTQNKQRRNRTTLEGSSCGSFKVGALGCRCFTSTAFGNMTLDWLPGLASSRGYNTSSIWPLSWHNVQAVEFVFSGVGQPSIEPRCTVESVRPLANGSGTEILMVQPCFGKLMKMAPFIFSEGVYPRTIENIADLVGTAGHEGEWWAPARSGAAEIWYGLREGEPSPPPLTAAAPFALVEAVPGVSRVRFEQLNFELSSRGPRPSSTQGYVDMQAGFHTVALSSPDAMPGVEAAGLGVAGVAAALHFVGAQDVTIANCSFSRLGGSAVWLDRGSRNCSVSYSRFSDVSGAAVLVGSMDQDNETARISIHDNTIENVGSEYHGSVAVTVVYAKDALIAHNEIRHPPYSGISIGWGSPSYASNNTIEGNHIFRALCYSHYMSDGGSIYTLGAQPGSTVRANYLHNECYSTAAIYHDASSGWWETRDNVVADAPNSSWVLIHGYPTSRAPFFQPPNRVDRTYVDSVSFRGQGQGTGSGSSANTGSAVIDCTHWGTAYGNVNCTITNTTVVKEGAWPPRAAEIMRNAGPRPYGRACDRLKLAERVARGKTDDAMPLSPDALPVAEPASRLSLVRRGGDELFHELRLGTRMKTDDHHLVMNSLDWRFLGGGNWSSQEQAPPVGTPPGTLVPPRFNATKMTDWVDNVAFYTAAAFGDATMCFQFRWGALPFTTAGLVLKATDAQNFFLVEFPSVGQSYRAENF